MTIWRLRPGWNSGLPTRTKLRLFLEEMIAIATVDEVATSLENLPSTQSFAPGTLFFHQKERDPADAVAF